jgi:hypothetical protein
MWLFGRRILFGEGADRLRRVGQIAGSPEIGKQGGSGV